MKLRDLKEGDILIVNGKQYNRTDWFSCEDPKGDTYYRLEGEGGFRKFIGQEEIAHFSDNVYILES